MKIRTSEQLTGCADSQLVPLLNKDKERENGYKNWTKRPDASEHQGIPP